jgi:hypothetical protein
MPKKAAGKRMASDVEQVKEHDCQAKGIMVGRSLESSEGQTLEFWCCEQGAAYIAGEYLSTHVDLEGITVNERYGAIRGNEEIPVVYVTNHVTLAVENCESAGDVGADVNNEAKVYLRECVKSALGGVEHMDFLPR